MRWTTQTRFLECIALKIAVLSDVHGNIAALDAVLADAAACRADMIVNLGDICSGPLFPAATADRLMALNLPTIRGNHERQVLTLAPDDMGLSDRHAMSRLNETQLAWLAGLPETLQLSDDILMVHGTPASDVDYFLETVTETGLRAATLDEVHGRAKGAHRPLILCGHTHVPRIVPLGDGRLIVNPGSVGLPAYADNWPCAHVVECESPHARYAVVTHSDGAWTAEIRLVDYDWCGAARVALANGRADWARALATGRV